MKQEVRGIVKLDEPHRVPTNTAVEFHCSNGHGGMAIRFSAQQRGCGSTFDDERGRQNMLAQFEVDSISGFGCI
jgi:restriction endonuclease